MMEINGMSRNRLGWSLFLATVLMDMPMSAQHDVTAPMKDVNQVTDNTLDSLNKVRTARPVAGSSRRKGCPVLFLVGNSRTGTTTSRQRRRC